MLRWRLHYADETRPTVDEPPENASILDAPPGAIALSVIDDDGGDVIGCHLGSRERPIFYRKRSITANLTGDHEMAIGAPRTDCVVWGRGWETDDRVEAVLWAIWPNGKMGDCPARMGDEVVIRRAVLGV